jgi:hypothetical protein
VPTAPKVNTKLLEMELVNDFMHLHLERGLGGHGGCCPWHCFASKLLNRGRATVNTTAFTRPQGVRLHTVSLQGMLTGGSSGPLIWIPTTCRAPTPALATPASCA